VRGKYAISLAEAMVVARERSKLEKRHARHKRYYDSHPGAMQKKNTEVRAGSTALTETLEFFNRIVKSVDQITTSMEEVAKASDAQATTVTGLITNVQNVSNIIQGTAKEAVDAAAATEETSASIDQIANVISNVNKVVEKVTLETSKFRV
jgi:methyl-accepting chemotaxis protein